MFKKVKPLMLLILVFCGLALLGSQVWAQPPKAQEIIFGEDNDIKVQFLPNGDVKAVYFLNCEDDLGCCDTGDSDCWEGPAVAKPGVICTCVGSECTDDLQENITLQNDTTRIVDCHDIILVLGQQDALCMVRDHIHTVVLFTADNSREIKGLFAICMSSLFYKTVRINAREEL